MEVDIFGTIVHSIENYGWYMLLFGLVFAYVYQKILKSYIDEYEKRKNEEEYAAKYHKNPDLFVERQIAQQQYAMKLQEKYKSDAEEYKKKLEEKEAKKREEYRLKFEGIGGEKLGSSSNKDKSNSFKPEYNPLTGAGSSSNYRPPRRSACSRGGCG
ncbi:hypothetical protein NQ314_006003 [Rhamnusium bicolor]|uniref:Selenoprotein S n=1 Tax=Rhamnusium bicolor TaxID=1586634 RepID=A0AAV8ZB41_9CUCU|nr:hypothetical protein NQ314_006003 [Rhamnusium bicolor]